MGSLVRALAYRVDSGKTQVDSAIAAIRALAVEVWLLTHSNSILAFDSEIESNAVCGLEPSATSDSTPVWALAVPGEGAPYPVQEVARDSAVHLVAEDGVQVQRYSCTNPLVLVPSLMPDSAVDGSLQASSNLL